ncbi:MAG: hypothetical protein IIA36_11680 [Proteobacteria bacterium]|nr:hypothetical protein [Pseudomonadota bacterium]
MAEDKHDTDTLIIEKYGYRPTESPSQTPPTGKDEGKGKAGECEKGGQTESDGTSASGGSQSSESGA